MGTDTPKKNNIAVWIIVGILAVIIIRYIYVSNSTSTDISDTNSYISQNSVSPIEQITQQKLDTGSYEIIGTNHAPTVQNFYVLIKFKDLSEQNLQSFIDKFRREFCFGNCNIDLYDTKSVLSLIDKYPLE